MFYVLIFSILAVVLVVGGIAAMSRRRKGYEAEERHTAMVDSGAGATRPRRTRSAGTIAPRRTRSAGTGRRSGPSPATTAASGTEPGVTA